jgi:hypothetical protein
LGTDLRGVFIAFTLARILMMAMIQRFVGRVSKWKCGLISPWAAFRLRGTACTSRLMKR